MFKTIKYPGIDSDEPTFSEMDYKINKIKFVPRRQICSQNLIYLSIKYLVNGILKYFLKKN